MYSAANAVYVVGGAGFFTLAMQATKLGNDLKSDIAAVKAALDAALKVQKGLASSPSYRFVQNLLPCHWPGVISCMSLITAAYS